MVCKELQCRYHKHLGNQELSGLETDQAGIRMLSDGVEASVWLNKDESGGMIVIANTDGEEHASIELDEALSEAIRHADTRSNIHFKTKQRLIPRRGLMS